MTLPASGAISLSQVNVELGLSATAQIGMNDAAVRTLFGVPSGAISMSDGYGKANQFAFTISSNQTNANLRTLAVNAGWNESSKVVATINSGVHCSSNSTGTPGLTINGSFPNGVELINNGSIVGRGGQGAVGGNNTANSAVGSAGGLALSVSIAVTINNTGTIAGGGGGGGAGQSGRDGPFDPIYNPFNFGGGGGGGGGGFGAAGGWSGNAGNNTNPTNGSAGTLSTGGAGGLGATSQGSLRAGNGGAGGAWGAGGSSGQNGVAISNVSRAAGGGGSAGGAITGNSNITYIATGTRLGSIS